MQHLVGEVMRLQSQIQVLEDDHNNEKMARRQWQTEATSVKREFDQAKQKTENYPFVVALVDGDGVIFNDSLLARGSEGGSEAAYMLFDEIRKTLQGRVANVGQCTIMVHIFANFEDLSRKLYHVGLLKSPGELHDFARAFSLNQPLFSFVDVGRGKERADYKLKEMFRFFVNNLQCKNIIFAACHDNGYLPNLDQFKRDEEVGSRITLLESTSAEWQYRTLGFPVISFPSIFRAQPLPGKPAAFAQPVVPVSQAAKGFSQGFSPNPHATMFSPYTSEGTAAATPSASEKASPNLTNVSTNHSVDSDTSKPSRSKTASSSASTPQPPGSEAAALSYANVSSNTGNTSRDINIAPSKPTSSQRKAIYYNREDQRLDRPLPKADTVAELRLRKRLQEGGKVCNMYHLLDKCKNGANCNYQHGERLGAKEQMALRHKTRSTFCPRGSGCMDIDCILGHHCPNPNCEREDCYFGYNHFAGDLRQPVMKIYENEEVELIKPQGAANNNSNGE
ncbi:MAG: hypothetical protein M1831_000110 [Alyxoria varia]|nr:MAG: hypothetical protein M1831_000110 [Alyxoria varia]